MPVIARRSGPFEGRDSWMQGLGFRALMEPRFLDARFRV